MIAYLWFASAGLVAGILIESSAWRALRPVPDDGGADWREGHAATTEKGHARQMEALRDALGMCPEATVPQMADRIRAIRHARDSMAESVSRN